MTYLTEKQKDSFTVRAMIFTLFLGVVAVAMLLLTGCSTGLIKTQEISVQTITWEKRAPILCAGLKNSAGCAYVEAHQCRIVMREDAPDWVVAHEFKHCFGWIHGN